MCGILEKTSLVNSIGLTSTKALMRPKRNTSLTTTTALMRSTIYYPLCKTRPVDQIILTLVRMWSVMENDEGILNHIVLDTSSAFVILEKSV